MQDIKRDWAYMERELLKLKQENEILREIVRKGPAPEILTFCGVPLNEAMDIVLDHIARSK